jgi:hypothetical protein
VAYKVFPEALASLKKCQSILHCVIDIIRDPEVLSSVGRQETSQLFTTEAACFLFAGM